MRPAAPPLQKNCCRLSCDMTAILMSPVLTIESNTHTQTYTHAHTTTHTQWSNQQTLQNQLAYLEWLINDVNVILLQIYFHITWIVVGSVTLMVLFLSTAVYPYSGWLGGAGVCPSSYWVSWWTCVPSQSGLIPEAFSVYITGCVRPTHIYVCLYNELPD